MWIYIIVIFVVVYSLFKEMQSLGCDRTIFSGEDCDNSKGKAVKGTASSKEDTISKILDNIDYAVDYNSRFVKWRSFLLASFFGLLMLWFVIFQRIPSEWELVVGMLILFLMLSLLNNFYHFHLYRHIQININKSTDILRDRNDKLRNIEEYKTYVPYHNMDMESHLSYTPFLF